MVVQKIRPPRLRPGATIGVVSPSYYLEKKVLDRISQIFKDRGFNIVEGQSLNLRDNLYSGTAEQRAQDLNDMFANPKIDAIICARGGYGANRVLSLLDFELIRQNPKILIGYSDITAILLSITQYTGLVTFHGPMLTSYKDGFIKYNYAHFIQCLSGNFPLIIEPPIDMHMRVLKKGIATGQLFGGNLCLLSNRLGTADNLDTNDAILFIEDVDEQYYRFDRMMVHMQKAGMFKNIKGLIVGELVNMQDTNPGFGKTADEIVMDVCGDLNIPIISNFPCGHGKYQATLPISVNAELNAESDNSRLTILESPVV